MRLAGVLTAPLTGDRWGPNQNGIVLPNRGRLIDLDTEEGRDQRIGNWVVVIAYGVSGLLIIGGLVALAKLL